MSVTSEEKLVAKLENKKAYRDAYVIEHVKTSVPLQIRHLREQRELTQAQLAEQAKTTQTVISRLEDPNYGNLTLNSLLKIALALDIGLLVKFVPFSRLLTEFQDLSPKALSVKSFTEELAMLKAWAAKAKNTTLQARRDGSIAELATTHTDTLAHNITEVERYRQIQNRQIQIPVLTTATASAIIDVPSAQESLRTTGGISTRRPTFKVGVAIGSTTSKQGGSFSNSRYIGVITV